MFDVLELFQNVGELEHVLMLGFDASGPERPD